MAMDFLRESDFCVLMFVIETSCLYGCDAGSDYGACFEDYGAWNGLGDVWLPLSLLGIASFLGQF